ncbi:hypothetical protein Pmani_028032 [Petrolisthes manimaculis]|uniref:Uncharacterized protein n=1 Tax=Petrolisthes manimaculis TaxID=1843537 RepID=A0AAE1P0W2_9EUCA|nr:hypothetical protein Pmani_028032 [Petrolisthes manimaculis]
MDEKCGAVSGVRLGLWRPWEEPLDNAANSAFQPAILRHLKALLNTAANNSALCLPTKYHKAPQGSAQVATLPAEATTFPA